MDNQELIKKFKLNVAIKKFKEDELSKISDLKNVEKHRKASYKRAIAGLCASIVLISGVVVTATFVNIISTFGLGKAFDTAVNNGYVAKTNMNIIDSKSKVTDETGIIKVDNAIIGTKINDFLMDDLNISIHFNFEIDENMNKSINLDNLHNVELEDLIITDENKNILFCANQTAFDKYCKENNLDYEFQNFNEHYYNCGLNTFVEMSSQDDRKINFVYNVYSEKQKFPKSKKIFFEFSKISLQEENYSKNSILKINMDGALKVDFDIPEEIYNRSEIPYRVVDCTNDNIHIYSAHLTNTGFEIGMIISNIERPEYPKELFEKQNEMNGFCFSTKEEFINIYGDEKYWDMFIEYETKSHPINTSGTQPFTNWTSTAGSYVENENGKKFQCSTSPTRKANSNFISNNEYDFYETFELTKYEATDLIKVVITVQDKPVIIKLQKAN